VTRRQDRVEISATVAPLKRTGVGLETLTACAVAALSVRNSLLEQ
jgi:molybdenum cofactor biosynthesis enzyme